MSGIQKGKALVGIAYQPTQGVPAEVAEYVHGISGGRVVDLQVKNASDPVTTGQRTASGSYRESVIPTGDIATHAWLQAIGLYLYGVLGAVVTTALGGGRYSHVFTVGDTLPWLTRFGNQDSKLLRVADTKLSDLELKWSGNSALALTATPIGTEVDFDVDAIADEDTVTESDPDRYTPMGGTFSLAIASPTPAEVALLDGSIKIANKAAAFIPSGSVFPTDVDEGNAVIDVAATIRPDDWAPYLEMLTGTDDGTSPATDVVYGSFDFKFVSGADSLEIEGNEVPFMCDFPDADPDGGKATLALAATAEGDSPITITLVNDVPLYGPAPTS